MLFANFKAIAWGLFVVVLMLGLTGLLSGPIYAQVAGATLNGTVADASGAGVPNANVSIKNTATGVERDVTTDSDGFYSAPNLLPGTYEVTVSASGFSTAVQTGLTLTVGAVQSPQYSVEDWPRHGKSRSGRDSAGRATRFIGD